MCIGEKKKLRSAVGKCRLPSVRMDYADHAFILNQLRITITLSTNIGYMRSAAGGVRDSDSSMAVTHSQP